MRDLLLVSIVIAGSLYALRQPWVGAMLWTWVSLMNPHSLTYGFALSFPIAAMAAVATLIGLLITKERQSPFSHSPAIWLAVFMTWICITYLFSYNIEGSTEMLKKVLKVDLMILVLLMLLKTKRHIEILIWVIVFSLGFYGVKGGIFTIMTGGNYRVWGPGGFIGGNNEIALALVITVPLMRFVQLQSSNRWIRHALSATMLLSVAAALGTHSRGALLGVGAMAIYMWLKNPSKFIFGTVLVTVGIGLALFMPDQWFLRMETIENYQEDASAMGRINAWWTAYNVAKTHITGAGFDMYNAAIFSVFAPEPTRIHAAHSIFFQVLGEHGFIGLVLFIGIWLSVWRVANSIIEDAKNKPDFRWCSDLAKMCQVSLVGYAVGGSFLSLAYFDLPYNILVICILTKRWIEEHIKNANNSISQGVTPKNRFTPAVGIGTT